MGESAMLDEPALRAHVPEVWIEYPKAGEVLKRGHYTFQVCAAPQAVHVDLSVDGGPWLPCRESMGLWWHDWDGGQAGAHWATARIHLEGGMFVLSEPRIFESAT